MNEEYNEWDQTEEVNLPEKKWNEVWENIERKRKSAARVIWIRKTAIAASIIALLSVTGNYLFFNNQEQPVITASKEIVMPQHRTHVNNTKKVMNIILPDSSVALLSPGDLISYSLPFIRERRDIFLEGQARFNVKQDKTRPFTVFAGGLTTTAIGTEFTVNTHNKQKGNVSVQLHSGKVLIKPIKDNAGKWKKDIYLDPGQELNFNPETMVAAVKKIGQEKIAEKKPAKQKEITSLESQDQLEFVNAPLKEVIQKLENHYNRPIKYNNDEIANMNFTGTISKNDSLMIVLKVLAQMNDLDIVMDEGNVELKKNNN